MSIFFISDICKESSRGSRSHKDGAHRYVDLNCNRTGDFLSLKKSLIFKNLDNLQIISGNNLQIPLRVFITILIIKCCL